MIQYTDASSNVMGESGIIGVSHWANEGANFRRFRKNWPQLISGMPVAFFCKIRSKQNAHFAKNNAMICPKIDPLPLTSINESL